MFIRDPRLTFFNILIASIELKTFLYLIIYLFLLLTIYFFNWIKEHPLKEHWCNFKMGKGSVIKRPTDGTTSTKNGQTSTTGGQTGTTSGQMSTTTG